MTCKNCAHARKLDLAMSGVFECWRFPPKVMLVPGQHPITGAQVLNMNSISPLVNEDFQCGEWVPVELNS